MTILPTKLMASLMALAITLVTMLIPLTGSAMAMTPLTHPIAFATMSNKMDAAAKEAEGKLESAYGELTGDTGHQIKGKAKQVQASAMNTAENLKKGAQSVARNVRDAAGQVADDLS
ncbi:hypothetical protein BBFGKLBO_01242 [Synechococcus sp. CBW1107]|jgi:uncharacterized protein YjbJ (UPF0337 family)|uniref:CsbD family protein n=1 Tax=Synechococcus sp. CBW1107 TaxID=2789857 RepID=UPI001E5CB801|nr:CsbD family protein [Synechococcus sp. CBW1107]CAK6692477.1 hypothetical protein BBFGKLBO_01242 [Synechococcus sp. CBW1107]